MVLKSGRPFRSALRIFLAALLVCLIGVVGFLPADANASSSIPATVHLMLTSNINLSSSANPVAPGSSTTITANVAEVSGNTFPATGTVTFLDGVVILGTGVLNGTGNATWTGAFTLGTHNLTATYVGDTNYNPGTSPVFALPVVPAAATAAITFPVGTGPNLTTDGTTVDASVSATSSVSGGVDLPNTRFTVSFAGIAGLTWGPPASNIEFQQFLGGIWVDVPLSGSPLAGIVGDPNGVDLAPNSTVTVPLRFITQPGTPIGALTMTTTLVSSTDGGSTFPNVIATATQAVNVIRLPTVTTVGASSVLTNALTAQVPLHSTVSPSVATGTVTFLDNGVVTGASTVSAGVADFTATVHTGAHLITATYSGDGSLYATSTSLVPAAITVTPAGGAVHALTPRRILDTRNGIGAPKGVAVPAFGSLILQVSGKGNLPVSNIEAGILNMTIRTSGASGYLTMYASDRAAPNVSSLSFDANVITAGLTIVPVSAAGQVTIVNHSAKPINLLADSGGYFANQLTSLTLGGRYNGFAPFNLLNTSAKAMAPGASVIVQMTGRSSGASRIPSTGVASVMLELTGTNPSGDGFVSAYPGLTAYPDSSVLNFSRHVTRSNRVIVAVGTDGTVIFKNSRLSSVGLLIDVVGYFTSDNNPAGGTTYVPLAMANRLVSAVWPTNAARYVQIAGRGGVPPYNAFVPPIGVIANITGTAQTADTQMSVYPSGTHPIATDLVIAKGRTVSNLVIARILNGRVILWNKAGNTKVNIDVFGWFG